MWLHQLLLSRQQPPQGRFFAFRYLGQHLGIVYQLDVISPLLVTGRLLKGHQLIQQLYNGLLSACSKGILAHLTPLAGWAKFRLGWNQLVAILYVTEQLPLQSCQVLALDKKISGILCSKIEMITTIKVSHCCPEQIYWLIALLQYNIASLVRFSLDSSRTACLS